MSRDNETNRTQGTSQRKPWVAPGRSDLWATIVVGALVAIGSVIATVGDLMQVVPNRDIAVAVPAGGVTGVESVRLPLGPGGAEIDAQVDVVTITVSSLPTGAHIAAVIEAVVPKLIVIAVIACLIALCRNLLAGRFFSRANTWLVTGIGLAIAIGWLVQFLTQTVVSNAALAEVAERELYEQMIFRVDPLPLAAALGVGALAAAFYAGERMQRDTEGLV